MIIAGYGANYHDVFYTRYLAELSEYYRYLGSLSRNTDL